MTMDRLAGDDHESHFEYVIGQSAFSGTDRTLFGAPAVSVVACPSEDQARRPEASISLGVLRLVQFVLREKGPERAEELLSRHIAWTEVVS